MSLRLKFITNTALVIAISLLGTGVYAQQEKPAPPASPEKKVEKQLKGERGGFGQRGFGRRKFGGGMFGGGHFGRMGKFGRFGMRGGMMRMRPALNLTDAQKQQINALRESNKPTQAQIDELRSIMEARRSGTITEDQKARIKAVREEMQAKRKAMHEQFMNILTTEQKALIEKHKTDMKQRMDEFRKQRELRRQQKPAGTTNEKPKIG